MAINGLLDAWRVSNEVSLQRLGLCPDEAMELKPGKGKTIRSNWVHIVGVRRAHVEAMLETALEASGESTAAVFARLDAKPIRWTVAKFFGYSVAHKAHHRSQIEIALRLGGFELPEAATYGLWDWPCL